MEQTISLFLSISSQWLNITSVLFYISGLVDFVELKAYTVSLIKWFMTQSFKGYMSFGIWGV